MNRDDIPFEIGDLVEYRGRDNYDHLRPGDLVTVVDIIPGIFAGDYYAVVKSDDGSYATAYTWRFSGGLTI